MAQDPQENSALARNSRSTPARIFLVGPSGSGKTVVGEPLAAMMGMKFIDTDREILAASGETSISKIFQGHGEKRFREMEKETVKRLVAENAPMVIATGGGLPAIPQMMSFLTTHGLVIYLKAEIGTLWRRLTFDPIELQDRPLLKDRGEDGLRSLVMKRDPVYSQAAVILRTDVLSVDEVCRAAKAIIQEG